MTENFLFNLIQVSSTIVSLVGAILITKLIDLDKTVLEKRTKLEGKISRWRGNLMGNCLRHSPEVGTYMEYSESFLLLRSYVPIMKFESSDVSQDCIKKFLVAAEKLTSDECFEMLRALNVNTSHSTNFKNNYIPEIKEILTEIRKYYQETKINDYKFLLGILIAMDIVGTFIPILYLAFCLQNFVIGISVIFLFFNLLLILWFFYQLCKFILINKLII